MVYIIRWTLSHWIFYYLVEVRGFEAWFGAKCLVWYEVGGFVGGLAAGYLSDLLFKGKRGVVHILFFASLIPLLFVFSQVSQVGSQFFLIQVVLTGIGFFIFGPQMLLAVHAVEVTHKKASSTAVGFLGIIAYVGSAMTGGPLGYMVKHSGWQSVFTMMAVCASVGMCAIVPLLKKRKQPLVLTT